MKASINLKGKEIKDYLLGQTLSNYNDMYLVAGVKNRQTQVTILMIEKKNIENASFVAYQMFKKGLISNRNNILQQNKLRIHPSYIQIIQSTQNIYLIMEKIQRIQQVPSNKLQYQNILKAIVFLYKNLGEFKVEENQIFVTMTGNLVYLPFYKKMQTTSKFYAQFHNKSIFGDYFGKLVPPVHRNKILDIFIKNIDTPQAADLIYKQICDELHLNPQVKMTVMNYPNLDDQTEDVDDEEILNLMSQVKVNSNMKKEAGEQFLRQSSKKTEEHTEDKEIKNIIDSAQSSMFVIKEVKSSTDKTKVQFKINQSKMERDQFQLYFLSYCQTLKFMKKSVKQFLEFYKNGFAGIISSYLLCIIITLRKLSLINALSLNKNVFNLEIDLNAMKLTKYISYLKKDLKSEAKMIAQLKTMIQNCQMPMKTYSIIAPYLEDDISEINQSQIQNFTFFFLSALMKNKQVNCYHFLYVLQVMYMLLHRNFEIIFFESDFPLTWNKDYFDMLNSLIECMVPNWSIK